MQLPLFQAGDYLTPKCYFFKKSPLGQIHDSLPLKQLGACLPEKSVDRAGAPSLFDNEGMIALMFLKHYLNISDEKLIERFNTDLSLQLFCGKLLDDGQCSKNKQKRPGKNPTLFQKSSIKNKNNLKIMGKVCPNLKNKPLIDQVFIQVKKFLFEHCIIYIFFSLFIIKK